MSTTAEKRPGVHSNDHGMLMAAEDQCFGHLFHFEGHGVYDPELGLVDVDPALVDPHNKILDEAYIKGLDENCKVGQGSFFYHTKKDGRDQVTTFTGTLVSSDVTLKGKSLTFRRAGKTYRGRISKNAQSFNFKRVVKLSDTLKLSLGKLSCFSSLHFFSWLLLKKM
jgi:hypothetical protein